MYHVLEQKQLVLLYLPVRLILTVGLLEPVGVDFVGLHGSTHTWFFTNELKGTRWPLSSGTLMVMVLPAPA
jgi:hypothetical protein